MIEAVIFDMDGVLADTEYYYENRRKNFLLENGIPIKVVETDYRGRSHASIDSPNDVAVVEKLLDAEGELAPL